MIFFLLISKTSVTWLHNLYKLKKGASEIFYVDSLTVCTEGLHIVGPRKYFFHTWTGECLLDIKLLLPRVKNAVHMSLNPPSFPVKQAVLLSQRQRGWVACHKPHTVSEEAELEPVSTLHLEPRAPPSCALTSLVLHNWSSHPRTLTGSWQPRRHTG